MCGQVIWQDLCRGAQSIKLSLSLPSQEIFVLVFIFEDTNDLEQVLTDGWHPADLASIFSELFPHPLHGW